MSRRHAIVGTLALVAACSPPDAVPPPPEPVTAPPAPEPAPTTAPTSPPSPVPSTPAATVVTAPAHRVAVSPPTAPPAAPGAGGGGGEHTGRASWYARGARTASGERFDPDGFTTAHRTLPFGTQLRVCHGGRCVTVRVNDRGPSARTGRELDLSRAAFGAIAPLGAGVVTVTWEAA